MDIYDLDNIIVHLPSFGHGDYALLYKAQRGS